ncbi:hypothetical protein [Luteolibacter sp. Populi]|uniref:hypothetical protein n=1 Tax=Luteolibacter sp. Populi TaxID=3230487 RepID=UPI003467B0C7
MNTYDIHPLRNGSGVGLTDSLGRHSDLWFRTAVAAMEYAGFSARRDGGTIRVFTASGTVQLEREVRADLPRRAEPVFDFARG